MDRNVILHGIHDPLPAPVKLKAGLLDAVYESGNLRNISLGQNEVVNTIYFALRDRSWNDVPGKIKDEKIQAGTNSFEITFNAENQAGDIHFTWQVKITGSPSGEIRYAINGQAQSTFWCNRIGLCVLHPANLCMGSDCLVEQMDGSQQQGAFPCHISPHQPFTDFRSLTYPVIPGLWVKVGFEGDTFEMEDQRNWSDDSFKTYSTPLRLPYPVEIKSGTSIKQAVTISFNGQLPPIRRQTSSKRMHPLISIQAGASTPLPRIGLGIASHAIPLNQLELERLRRLNLHHLRVDLLLFESDFKIRLDRACQAAQELGVVLEIALFFSDQVSQELDDLCSTLAQVKPEIGTWLIFQRQQRATPVSLVELVKPRLAIQYPAVPLGGGSDIYFAEVNRNRPVLNMLDFVSFSLNPQVHVTDNQSLMESLPSQARMVETAQLISDTKSVMVSPITFKARFNPSSGMTPVAEPGELPLPVDPRQLSLFGACWTLGSLKYLAEGGLNSATYFETTGWRGVMETSAGSMHPERFFSIPECVYPLYHILADFGEFAHGSMLKVESDQPQRAIGLGLLKADKLRILLGNLTPSALTIDIMNLAMPARVRYLDETSAERAIRFPEEWRKKFSLLKQKRPQLVLLPYAVATVDCHLTPSNDSL